MTARMLGVTMALLLVSGGDPTPAAGQTLAARVAAASGSQVEFQFGTRPGVCGDGQSYIHYDDGYSGSFNDGFNGISANPCVHGPARVVLDRADAQVVRLRVFVGAQVAPSAGASSLGTVSSREATAYLLHLAATAQGAVARQAILPAMLADSAQNAQALVALARDPTRPREIRRSAIAWLPRDGATATATTQVLVQLGTDASDSRSIRQQALTTLAQLDAGAGIAPLIRLAGDSAAPWVARTALSALSQSGDPRAHDYLRGVVRRAALPDAMLAVAIRGFGMRYASAADLADIRKAWPTFTGEQAQGAAISAAAEFGGQDNVRWLLSLGGDMGATASVRRRALQGAERAGARTADFMKLYDAITDPDTKAAIISTLGQVDDQAAVDALLTIARHDESAAARRRAVSVLGRSSDPRVKQALAGIVVGR